MKILKVVGIVAGVHALALLVIFASPGCSSSKGQSAQPAAPAAPDAPAPVAAPADISMPAPAPAAASAAPAPVQAGDASAAPSGILYSPTRPGTPAAAALEVQPVSGVTPATTYTVVSRDNLSTIAKKNHLKVSELAAANNLRAGSTLHVGQKLIIPSKAGAEPAAVAGAAPAPAGPAAPAAGPAKPAGESVKYTVKSGETLGAIARKYGVRVGDIATANAISDPQKIHPGQELIIPGGSLRKSGAAKAAKPAAAAAAPAAAPPPEPAPVAAPAAAEAPAPAPGANDVPVIKIDDNPPAPAAKP